MKVFKNKSRLEKLSLIMNVFFILSLFSYFLFNNTGYGNFFTILWIVISLSILVSLGIKEVHFKNNKIGYIYYILAIAFIYYILYIIYLAIRVNN